MADFEQTATHITNLRGRIRVEASSPSNPVTGDEYWDSTQKAWVRYSGNNWLGFRFSSTSTSTSTTTSTSTSTSTTSTSSSTSTTTSTSTSTTTTI